MAKPRVFISSTYYDLKHIRSSLESFVESLGFEPILSEKGDIPYDPSSSPDESCYGDAARADIFVLVVGSRYGAEAGGEGEKPDRPFYEEYESVTRREYRSAAAHDVPTYVLIEGGVHAEYRTFQRNRDRTDIAYAHVDSVNVFSLIGEAMGNPTQTFDGYADIEAWLREQWSGRFRELLQRESSERQIASLKSQVGELREVTETLKTYLESVMTNTLAAEAQELIEKEKERLEERRAEALRANWLVESLLGYGYELADVVATFKTSGSFEELHDKLEALGGLSPEAAESKSEFLRKALSYTRADIDDARELLGLPPLVYELPKRSDATETEAPG